MGTKVFQKFWKPRQYSGALRVTRSKFHTEDPQILGATVQNLVALVTWRPAVMYPCSAKCYVI
jgi:hypothetical protein